MSEWYKIEELIPAEHAIGGKEFWHHLLGIASVGPCRFESGEAAAIYLETLRNLKRIVRLVKVTEEVIA